MISKETGVQIRTVAVPGTLIAVDCSRKAASASSLEELHEDAMGSCRDFYTNIAEPGRTFPPQKHAGHHHAVHDR